MKKLLLFGILIILWMSIPGASYGQYSCNNGYYGYSNSYNGYCNQQYYSSNYYYNPGAQLINTGVNLGVNLLYAWASAPRTKVIIVNQQPQQVSYTETLTFYREIDTNGSMWAKYAIGNTWYRSRINNGQFVDSLWRVWNCN